MFEYSVRSGDHIQVTTWWRTKALQKATVSNGAELGYLSYLYKDKLNYGLRAAAFNVLSPGGKIAEFWWPYYRKTNTLLFYNFLLKYKFLLIYNVFAF